jgi:translation initiation factor eIF-2B subunit beta
MNNLNNVEIKIQSFITSLKRRQIEGSFNVAKETAKIMRMEISNKIRFNTLHEIISTIKQTGKRLVESQPLASGNIIRRILYIVREEYQNFSNIRQKEHSLYLLGEGQQEMKEEEYHKPIENSKELKAAILVSLNELIDELQNMYRNIADQAIEHIHANEVIMTFGGSKTVEEFLKSAAKKRKFEVICVESSPSYRGHDLAISLSKLGIDTILIPDSAVFAMMARVNKVILGTHAVMANGGLIAPSGTHMIAVAAKHHKVPFVVCTGLYKLCPLYSFDQDTFNETKSPSSILKFEEAETLEKIHVQNPSYDYIPAELISIYITNIGGHNPSYIYRLLAEYYNPSDYIL